MSTNISGLTNVGTSMNFDGQALQNQQEAEMESEEQMQQNELRQLLSNAFDDLDDDILSIASSDDDFPNASQVSSGRPSLQEDPSSGSMVMMAGRTRPGQGPMGQAVIPQPANQPRLAQQRVAEGDNTSTITSHIRSHPSAGSTPLESFQEPQRSRRRVVEDGGDGVRNSTGSITGLLRSVWSGGSSHSEREMTDASSQHNSEEVLGQYRPTASAYPTAHHNSVVPTSVPHHMEVPASVPPQHHTDMLPAAGFPTSLGHTLWNHDHNSPTTALPHHYDHHHHHHQQPYPPPISSHSENFLYGGSDVGYGMYGVAGNNPLTAFPSGGVTGWPATHVEQSLPSSLPEHLPASYSSNARVSEASSIVSFASHSLEHSQQTGNAPSAIGSNNMGSLQSMNSPAAFPTYSAPLNQQGSVPATGRMWTGGVIGEEEEGSVGRGGSTQQQQQHHHPSGGDMIMGRGTGGGLGQIQTDRRTEVPTSSAGLDGDSFDNYTVTYRKQQQQQQQQQTFKPNRPTSAAADLKVNFIRQEGENEESSQLTQLQMLYQSRGRQLEDLRGEMEQATQDSAKELRMLKHLLTVATGEKEGREVSLKQCQQMLQDVRDELTQTKGQLQGSQAQLKAMTDSKTELGKKLQSAETAVETLSHQVVGLQGADSLMQARHQHEAVVGSMQQRFDAQLLDLKQQLDLANNAVALKTEEIAKLQEQLCKQTKLMEEAQVSRGETINQLTHSLEESQQRFHALLNASSSDENSKLRAQLQQTAMSKKMADDMCNSLQCEVQELKEQLNMLESATSLGALTSSSGPGDLFMDDSISDLGLRKTLDFSTPDSNSRFDENQSSMELVGKLRKELERCVTSNRKKRAEVGDLQRETKRLKEDMEQLQQQLTDSQNAMKAQQVKLTSYEERLDGNMQPSAVESRLKRDIDNLRLEKDAVMKDVEDYKKRMNELSSSEEKLTQINSQLKQQMAAMVSQHDQDMREAVERCRKACEDAHKTAREEMEHRIRSELFADKQELVMKYEGKLTTTRGELDTAQEELDKVKEMYVQASRDLVQREEELSNKDKDMEEAVETEKARWEREHDAAMEKVWQDRLQKARANWETERQQAAEKEWLQRMENERERWKSEQQSQREKEWQERLEKERKQWEQDREISAERDWQQELESERRKWEAERRAESEKDWLERLEREKREWESMQKSASDIEWRQRLDTERRSWEAERDRAESAALESRLEKERRSWQVLTDRQALEQTDMAVEQARRQWQHETEKTLKSLNARLDECRSKHQAELVAMETKWRQEMVEKERKMEEHMQNSLDSEVGARLEEQKRELSRQAEDKLKQELSRAEKHHAEELRQRVKEEGERVAVECRRQAETERKEAVEIACSQLETRQQQQQQQQAGQDLQELTKWKDEAVRLQGELTRQEEAWSSESGRLAAEKDEERRQAVASVRSECQGDYQHLMAESQSTLDAALESARTHHRQQLEEVEDRYKEELAALRTVEQELRQALSSAQSSDSDKTRSPAGKKDVVDRLRKEVEKLKKEVDKRDQLLQQTDSHMEQEVERLKETMADTFSKQREKDTLQLQAQYSQAIQIAQKERTRLERQVEQLMERLGQDQERQEDELAKLADAETELNRVLEEKDQLADELASLKVDQDRLAKEFEETEMDREREHQELQEGRQRLQKQVKDVQQDKDHLSQLLKECQTALQAVAQEKDLAAQEHQKLVSGLQQRCEQTKVRAQKLESALKAVNNQHKQDVDSLHATHQQKMAALMSQLVQLQKQHKVALEELQEQHDADKRAMTQEMQEELRSEKLELMEELQRKQQEDTHSMMEEMKQQAHFALANSPSSQIDGDDTKMKTRFSHVIQKMMESVISHVSQSNERAASTMRVEIRRERQRTIHHLRQRCKSRLHHILDSHIDRSEKPLVWTALDQALDSLFDTVSSSCSATPNTSAPVTPRSSEDDQQTGRLEKGNYAPEDRGAKNRSMSSGPLSTPQSAGTDRYDLPSILGRLQLEEQQQQIYSSLEELHSSGVFYNLEADDATSVTDSELDFKAAPWPSAGKKRTGNTSSKYRDSRSSAKLVVCGTETVAAAGRAVGRQGGKETRFTPPRMTKNDLSVFVDKKTLSASQPSLLSPKLHRPGRKDETAWKTGGGGEGEETGVDESGAWKEVDGKGWTRAVGGSNLWQAFSDLRTLAMDNDSDQSGDPRRKLNFASSVDMATDSDTSFASSIEGRSRSGSGGGGGRKTVTPETFTTTTSTAATFERRSNTPLSRSEDFSRKDTDFSVPQGGYVLRASAPRKSEPQLMFTSLSPVPFYDNHHPEYTSVTSHLPEKKLGGRRSEQAGHSKNQGSALHARSQENVSSSSMQYGKQPVNSAASKLLLNPKDFLSQAPTSSSKASMAGQMETATRTAASSHHQHHHGRQKKDTRERLTGTGQQASGQGHTTSAAAGDALDTLGMMLDKLGIKAPQSSYGHKPTHKQNHAPRTEDQGPHRPGHGHHAQQTPAPHSQAQGSRSHKDHSTIVVDRRSSENVMRTAASSSSSQRNPTSAGKAAKQGGGQRAKTRTRSAEGVSLRHLVSGGSGGQGEQLSQHQAGGGMFLSVFRPHHSSQNPAASAGHRSSKGHHQHKKPSKCDNSMGGSVSGDVMLRSMEDLPTHSSHPTLLSHKARTKWCSEQALNVLGEALTGETGGDSEYCYTPLQQFLPPPSPSTSLVSTYSVSEGDLRNVPLQNQGWTGNIF